MDSANTVDEYVQRLDFFRRADCDRDRLIAGLIEKYNELGIRYEQKCVDYEDAVLSRRSWQNKAVQSGRNLEEIQRASGCNQFVFVLLDGDGAYFRDDLIARGDEGGEEAAQRLLANMKNYLKSIYPESNVGDWSIIIQVVLNQFGLSRTLFDRGIVKNPNLELPAFARAFGRTQSLFSFVDVGSGKERADHKVREMMRVMLKVNQCRHVIFGPCLDNGYLPFLGEHKGDPSTAPRITLLETSPAAPGFRTLGFRHVKFPDVFRSEPLPPPPAMAAPPRSTSTSTESGSASLSTQASSLVSALENGTSSSWAALGKAGVPVKSINIAPKKSAQAQPKFYIVNVDGERLDEELPRWDPSAERRFVNRITAHGNFCNNHHLKGGCEAEEYCDYQHGERLNLAELLVLKHKARSRKCRNGSYCDDASCYSGHHCRFGKQCGHQNCRFADTHHVNLIPATKVYEDGTRETITH